jgi:hypothetical protein
VLDSHGSLQSPPSTTPGAEALHERIRRDYADHDLELHELAYSRYQWTHQSFQSVLANVANVGRVDKQHGVVTLPQNKLFDQMIDLGYRPIIHSSDYLDLCEAARAGDPRCERYPVGHLGPPIPASQSYPLILASLLHRLAGGPALAQKSRTFGVINSVLAFEQLIDDVPLHRNGAFVFAHFMLPHEPYILDESCHVDVGEVMRKPYQEYYGRIRPGDAARYWAEYIPQAACTHSLVMKLVEALKEAGLYEETTLIVHGDHGARIRTTRFSGREPAGLPRSQRTRLDFLSAHFAVKPGAFPMQPGSAAGIASWATLDNLIAERMGWPLRSLERRPVKRPED